MKILLFTSYKGWAKKNQSTRHFHYKIFFIKVRQMKFQSFIKDITDNICWEFHWICSLLAWMTARHLEGMFLISLPSGGLSELIFFHSFVIAFLQLRRIFTFMFCNSFFQNPPHVFNRSDVSRISDHEPGGQVFYQSYGKPLQVQLDMDAGSSCQITNTSG